MLRNLRHVLFVVSCVVRRQDHVDRRRGANGRTTGHVHDHRDIGPYYPCLRYATSYLLWRDEEKSVAVLQRYDDAAIARYVTLVHSGDALMTIDRAHIACQSRTGAITQRLLTPFDADLLTTRARRSYSLVRELFALFTHARESRHASRIHSRTHIHRSRPTPRSHSVQECCRPG